MAVVAEAEQLHLRNIYMPSVSIIIPIYNSAKIIGHVIEAILRQSYPPLEIMVVEDSSTENTAGAISSWGVS